MSPSVSATATAPAPGAPAVAGVHRTVRLRRIGAGLALILAPLGFLIANAGYAWATRHGGSDEKGADALALAAAHTGLLRASALAALIGCLLIIPAVLAGMRLTRNRAPWLTLSGGTLMIAGYVCYLVAVAGGFTTLTMARVGGPAGVFADVIDTAQSDAALSWTFLVFIAGNLLGTALFGAALLRSRAVPRWAAIAVLAWPALHITGLAAGSEWFEVAGAALQAAGFGALGVAVLRLADQRWELPGGHASSPSAITRAAPGPQAYPAASR